MKFIFLLFVLTIQSFALLDYEKNNIEVFNRVSKSVVFINTTAVELDFFNGAQERPRGLGSGYVWDKQGHIVTNFHVVEGAQSVTVTFPNNKTYPATVIGAEPQRDIAVLVVKDVPGSSLDPVEIGDSQKLQTGQLAIAIGNPFGLDHSMSTGIISALNRSAETFGGVTIRDMIQTDAAINPGNSGGPLLDSSGKLIGMNTQIISQSGTSSGVGFAVPQRIISSVVPQLIKFGKVIRPGLGIRPLDESLRYRFNLPDGVMIMEVLPKSPALKAKLRGIRRDRMGRLLFGDIITKINNDEIKNYDDLYNHLEKYKIGENVEISYMREGKVYKTIIALEKVE